MKLIASKNIISVVYKDEIVFAHSDIAPFISLVSKRDKTSEIIPLQNCEVLRNDEEIELKFYRESSSLKVLFREENGALDISFDETEDDSAFIFLHSREKEKIVGCGKIPFFDLKGKRLKNAERTAFRSEALRAVLGVPYVKIKDLVPSFIGEKRGVTIQGEVEELDFSSRFAIKVSGKIRKVLFAVGETKNDICNALYGVKEAPNASLYAPDKTMQNKLFGKEATLTAPQCEELIYDGKPTFTAALLNAQYAGLTVNVTTTEKYANTALKIKAFLPVFALDAPFYAAFEKTLRSLLNFRDGVYEYLKSLDAYPLKLYEEAPTQGFYLGELLVIFYQDKKSPTTEILFPEGKWINLFDKKTYEGGMHALVNKDMPFVFYPEGSPNAGSFEKL